MIVYHGLRLAAIRQTFPVLAVRAAADAHDGENN